MLKRYLDSSKRARHAANPISYFVETSYSNPVQVTPYDSGVDLSSRAGSDGGLARPSSSTAVQDQVSYFSDQWLHHRTDLFARQHTDLMIVPGDGQGVELHSAIILPQSVDLTSLLSTSKDQVPTILLPQVDRDTVLQMVDLLYNGQCFISLSHFYKLNHLLNTLGFTHLLKSSSLNSYRRTELKLENREYLESMGEALDDDEVVFIETILNSEKNEGLCSFKHPIEEEEPVSARVQKIKDIFGGQSSAGNIAVRVHSQVSSLVGSSVSFGKSRVVTGKTSAGVKYKKISNRPRFECDVCGLKVISEKRLKMHKKILCVKVDKTTGISLYDKTTGARIPKEKKPDNQRPKNLRSDSKGTGGKQRTRKVEYQRNVEEMKSQFPPAGKIKTSSNFLRKLRNSFHGNKRTGDKLVRKANLLHVRTPSSTPVCDESAESASNSSVLSSTQSRASRAVKHSRNNIPWVEDQEQFSDVSWVKKKSLKDLMEFEDLTEGEKAFYSLWNQFILDYKPGMCKVHLRSVLAEFIALWGREVKEKGLYRQFVTHLVMMEREGLIGQDGSIHM